MRFFWKVCSSTGVDWRFLGKKMVNDAFAGYAPLGLFVSFSSGVVSLFKTICSLLRVEKANTLLGNTGTMMASRLIATQRWSQNDLIGSSECSHKLWCGLFFMTQHLNTSPNTPKQKHTLHLGHLKPSKTLFLVPPNQVFGGENFVFHGFGCPW